MSVLSVVFAQLLNKPHQHDFIQAAWAFREDIQCNVVEAGDLLSIPHVLLVGDELIQDQVNQAVTDFVGRVNALAEHKMSVTNKLEGSHYAALTELVKEYQS